MLLLLQLQLASGTKSAAKARPSSGLNLPSRLLLLLPVAIHCCQLLVTNLDKTLGWPPELY
jgi:hypothetical protein